MLSAELGGTDHDVKNYFFGLSPAELRPILEEYGRNYGASAREYAELTLPKWRAGSVAMSGMVASRLFSLLPPRMPLESKYKLTEDLWSHVGPSSNKAIRVGRDATLDDVLQVVQDHMKHVVVNYVVPEGINRRFEWLAAGDVQLKQQLLNRLQDAERELVIQAVRQQFPVMRNHASGPDGEYTERLAQTVKVGKHELELAFDQSAEGVRLEEPSRRSPVRLPAARAPDLTWLWWVAGIGVALLIVLSQRQGG